MTKIMMTGGNGFVGSELKGWGVDPLLCDITNAVEVHDTVSSHKPDVIIHLAAISKVDYCEETRNEQTVINTNLIGTHNVLEAAKDCGARVVMLSSDHVFDGKWGWLRGYREDSTPNPVNFYGHSKLAAEALTEKFDNFKVVRTSYLFNKKRLKDKEFESQPTFIYRSFMYLPHFCSQLIQYVNSFDKMPTITHITGSKIVSWYKLMSEFEDVSPRDVEPNYTFAPRPHYGGLKTKYKLFAPISYEQGVIDMLGDSVS
jgi:dTDP-4-dehydrorhamnose reductase